MLAVLTFIMGASSGSFACACASRMLNGRSLFERSRCDSCQSKLGWMELIPIVSYVVQKGVCRHCKQTIHIQVLLFEIVFGAIISSILSVFGPTREGLALVFVTVVLLLAAEVDRRSMLVPDSLVVILMSAGIATCVVLPETFVVKLGAAVSVFLAVLLLRAVGLLLSGVPGMGLGDAKLFSSVGLVLGPIALIGLAYAVMIGGLVGIVGLATSRLTPKSRIPFVPVYCAGLLVAIVLFGYAV